MTDLTTNSEALVATGLYINGKTKETSETIAIVDPGKPGVVVGYAASATKQDAESAVASAKAAFPSWSALSAQVYVRLPEEVRTPRTDELALDILRSCLLNYHEDGSATCAFVMPATVDAMTAHAEDPLVNDQDWPLAIWLQLAEREGIGLGGADENRPHGHRQ